MTTRTRRAPSRPATARGSLASSGRLPPAYDETLAEIKERFQVERNRLAASVNSATVLFCWEVGRLILRRQKRDGWGAKVIDRLSQDLCNAFPDSRGFSVRNLQYMRSFATAWPNRRIVQEPLARISWYHNIALLEHLKRPQERLTYAKKSIETGWSHHQLVQEIRGGARAGDVKNALPPAQPVDIDAQVFVSPNMNRRPADVISERVALLREVDDLAKHTPNFRPPDIGACVMATL